MSATLTDQAAVQPGSEKSNLPGLSGVNVLYLTVMLLMVTAGVALQMLSPLVGLIGTEVLVILLPALAYLALRRLPVRQTLRLNWPGLKVALASLAAGLGIWFLGSWLGLVSMQVFGYSVNPGPDFLPDTPLKTFLIVAALVFFAPVCEEVLFRGVIQRAYEHRPWRAVVVVGVLFALFHLTLSGLVPLLPVSLVLGLLAWRSQSLISSILAHAANNLLAVLFLIISVQQPQVLTAFSLPSLPAALVGLTVSLTAIWLVFRWTAPQPQVPAARRPSLLARGLPLAVAAIIFLTFAALELVMGRFPEVLAMSHLTLPKAAWQETVTWKYELRNKADEPVGQATCILTPMDSEALLNCDVQNNGFELKQGSSFYKTERGFQKNIVDWETAGRSLLDAELLESAGTYAYATVITPTEDGARMQVTVDGQIETLNIPPDALLKAEWPWRLSGMEFTQGSVSRVTLAYPLKWDENAQTSKPQLEETILQVMGAEPVYTPAGNFIAWRVKVGDDQTAWYQVEEPRALVQYEDNLLRWVLVDVR